jgi:PKD repeat protein
LPIIFSFDKFAHNPNPMKKLCVLFFSVLGLCNAVAQINLTSSLVACYPLNGNATEMVNNLNGTLTGVSPTQDRLLVANSALSFSGSTTSFVQLPNSALLKPKAISIAGWFRATQFASRMCLIFCKNTFSSYHTAYGLSADFVGNVVKFRGCRQNGMTDDFINSTTSLAQNTWYHVVLTIDSTNMQIYVNGVLENSMINTINSFNYDPSKTVILGGTNELADNPFFFGEMDNLRFYSRVINSSEVSVLYNQDPSCKAAPVAGFSVSSLEICKGQAVTLKDLSTNSPTSWSWSMAGASPAVSTLSNPIITFPTTGTFTVSLTSSNSGGSSTATKTITVLPCTGVSVNGEIQAFSVYPNPVTDKLSIVSQDGNIDRIRVIDLTGAVLMEHNSRSGKTVSFDLSELSGGIYFLEITSEAGNGNLKIIKE